MKSMRQAFPIGQHALTHTNLIKLCLCVISSRCLSVCLSVCPDMHQDFCGKTWPYIDVQLFGLDAQSRDRERETDERTSSILTSIHTWSVRWPCFSCARVCMCVCLFVCPRRCWPFTFFTMFSSTTVVARAETRTHSSSVIFCVLLSVLWSMSRGHSIHRVQQFSPFHLVLGQRIIWTISDRLGCDLGHSVQVQVDQRKMLLRVLLLLIQKHTRVWLVAGRWNPKGIANLH